MNNYSPASHMGWLDFDATASERVSVLLRSLEEPATLDVLGLGTVRDALSDMLAPGITTIHTRLRYFLFVPWIFQRLEAEHTPVADFARKLRDAEARLIDCLRHLGSGEGVIGRVAGRRLKRMPSEIYWGGLGAWGIRRLDVSIAEYAGASATGRRRLERDDDGNATVRAMSMWAGIPPPPEQFLHREIDFKLRPDEAQALIECIQQRHPNSVLAYLCAMPDQPPDVEFPWELPANGMPNRLAEVLHHARCFSELTLGPQLLYNVLVARRAHDELGWNTGRVEANQLNQLTQWVTVIEGRHQRLCSWVEDRPRFWQLVDGHSSRSTRSFVNEIASRATTDPQQFIDDPAVHALIQDRERHLKSKRARLSHRAALENWHNEPVGGQFDFRWPIAKSYFADLAAAVGPTQGEPGLLPVPGTDTTNPAPVEVAG